MNAESLTIRLAGTEDAPELTRLAVELGYPTSIADMRRRCNLLADRSDHAVFVAERSDAVLLGWAHVARSVTLESGERGNILGLVVAPVARRGGVGRRLVAAAEQWSRAQGLERMVVRSNVKRAESHVFYPSIGYTLGKTQHVYVKELGAAAAPDGQ